MTENPRNILMVIELFYPIVGGAETQALLLSQKLVKTGNRVTVLTRKGRKELSADEVIDGINIHRLPVNGSSGFHKLYSIFLATIWLIKNRSSFDIIHCHGCNPLAWSILFTRPIIKKPYLVKLTRTAFLKYVIPASISKNNSKTNSGIITNTAKYLFYPVVKYFRTKLLKKANSVIAINMEIEKSLKESGFSNVVNIPNGVDVEKYSPVTSENKNNIRKRLNLATHKIIIIFSGRFTKDKNLYRLLSAWNKFIKEHPKCEAELILLGDAEIGNNTLGNELKDFVKQQNLTSVFFKGYVANVIDYLRAADIFVLPSLSEGLSNALLEAMACGLPAIASNIPGNRVLLDNKKNGLMFNPESIEELSACFASLVKDDNAIKTMGQKARKTIVDCFSSSIVIERIVNEYDRFTNDKK